MLFLGHELLYVTNVETEIKVKVEYVNDINILKIIKWNVEIFTFFYNPWNLNYYLYCDLVLKI